MRRFLLLFVIAFLLPGCMSYDDILTMRARSGDPQISEPAIAALRAKGQVGVDEMMAAVELVDPADPEAVAAYRRALDRVCRQKDCYASGLFWHTDLDAALVTAKATGKPILSLHLLGDLGDELSCANSRFFRATLYSDPRIASFMRQNFVLHWKSVRPVPKITVDFGDGRRLQRTITGNSVHYLLGADGTPIEIIPGLYAPDAFLAHLGNMKTLASRYATTPATRRDALLRSYHAAELRKVQRALDVDLEAIRNANLTSGAPVAVGMEAPKAVEAAPLAASKMATEITLLPSFDVTPVVAVADWKAIASLHTREVAFGAETLALIASKTPRAEAAGILAATKSRSEDPLVRIVASLRASVAEDTVRNEYDLHRRVHGWFASGDQPRDLAALNERVYTELFLTPGSDPWLGLLQPDVFTALDHNGVELTTGVVVTEQSGSSGR